MGLLLDLTQNIVNVQFAPSDGIFVSGDYGGFGRYAKIKKKDTQSWIGLDSLPTESVEGEPEVLVIGELRGSSYAVAGGNKDEEIKGKPTFVLCGSAVHRVGFDAAAPLERHSIILASHDGKLWSIAFEKITELSDTVFGLFIAALVWDKDANDGNGSFYAQTSEEGAEGCYQSTSGLSWSSGGGSFASHCKGKLPGKPDGYYGYDKAKDILMVPNDTGGIDITKNKGKDGEIKTKTDLGFMSVNCIAFAGGIWEAGGGASVSVDEITACTATSTDDGKTWQEVSKGSLGMHEGAGRDISTIVGAPMADFKKDG